LAQWWLDKVYLEPRYYVPINVNPNLLYPKANYSNVDQQLIHATNFIAGFVAYMDLIDTQQLPLEKYGDLPLCMDQYTKIVGSCRLPQFKKDKIIMYDPKLESSKNVVVMYKNRVRVFWFILENGLF
jgi:carnitine O-acetyltransferase